MRGVRADWCRFVTFSLGGILFSVAISLSGFLRSHLTSNVFSAKAFITNVPGSVTPDVAKMSLDHVQPTLLAESRMLETKVSTWDGTSLVVLRRLSILKQLPLEPHVRFPSLLESER